MWENRFTLHFMRRKRAKTKMFFDAYFVSKYVRTAAAGSLMSITDLLFGIFFWTEMLSLVFVLLHCATNCTFIEKRKMRNKLVVSGSFFIKANKSFFFNFCFIIS